MIDFNIIRSFQRNLIRDTDVYNIADISDHRIIRSKIKIPVVWKSTVKRSEPSKKKDIASLNDPKLRYVFEINVSNPLGTIDSSDERVDSLYEKIASAMTSAADTLLPTITKSPPSWLDDGLLEIINEKKVVIKRYGSKSQAYREVKYRLKYEDFKYLGHVITEDNNQEKAVSSRIGLGWAAYKKWKNVFDSPKASIMIKCKICMIYIQSIVLYRCECITWTERLMNKISVFHNHMLRNILRKRLCDKIPIDELHRKTK